MPYCRNQCTITEMRADCLLIWPEKGVFSQDGLDLTRARPGGGYPPVRFVADSEKTAAHSAAKFAIAVQSKQFDTFPKNDDPMTPNVTPPGHMN